MKLVINGEKNTISEPVVNVTGLLALLGVKSKHVGIELNGTVIDTSLFDETAVKEMDVIEIISFVGGG